MKHSIEKIAQLYNEGKGARGISKILGNISHETVSYHIRKAAASGLIKKRNRSEAAIGKVYRKHFFDQNYFSKIDTEPKAYILGFLYADGYNNESRGRIEINLAVPDREILEKIKKELKYENDLLILENENKVCLRLQSRIMSQQLTKLGCYQGKSLTCDLPDNNVVPESLFNHFLRGYFDGDGCVSYNQKNNDVCLDICGSNLFIEKLCVFLNEKFDSKRSPTIRRSISSVAFNGINQVKKFHEYLYKDASIFLERKFFRYKECIELYEKNSIKYPKVAKCNMHGNIIKIYENTISAFRDNPGTFPGNIWRAAEGIYSSHKGFKWKWIN